MEWLGLGYNRNDWKMNGILLFFTKAIKSFGQAGKLCPILKGGKPFVRVVKQSGIVRLILPLVESVVSL